MLRCRDCPLSANSGVAIVVRKANEAASSFGGLILFITEAGSTGSTPAAAMPAHPVMIPAAARATVWSARGLFDRREILRLHRDRRSSTRGLRIGFPC